MNAESTKSVITNMFRAFADRLDDPTVVLKDMAEDGEWWVAGSMSMSGSKTKAQLVELMRGVAGSVDGGLTMSPRPESWIIEGEKVAVEVDSRMKLKDGREYQNEYHFRIQMRGNQILQVKEYLDTIRAAEIFGY